MQVGSGHGAWPGPGSLAFPSQHSWQWPPQSALETSCRLTRGRQCGHGQRKDVKCKGLRSLLFREVPLPLCPCNTQVSSPYWTGAPMNASSVGTSHPLTHPQRQALWPQVWALLPLCQG